MNYLQTTKALQIKVYKSIGYNVNLCIYEKEKIKKETWLKVEKLLKSKLDIYHQESAQLKTYKLHRSEILPLGM